MHHTAGHNLCLNFEGKMTSLFGRKGRSNIFESGEGGSVMKNHEDIQTLYFLIHLYLCNRQKSDM